MTITTNPERIAPNCKQPPMTDAEMGERWRAGDPISIIANAAKRRNGLTVPEVRAIVHRECGLVSMGGGL